jgi:hypothetical protein
MYLNGIIFFNTQVYSNSQKSLKDINKFCNLQPEGLSLLKTDIKLFDKNKEVY